MMKKVFFALAVAAMFGLTACNCNKSAEEAADTVMQTVEAAAVETTDELGDAVEGLAEEMVDAASDAIQEVIAE